MARMREQRAWLAALALTAALALAACGGDEAPATVEPPAACPGLTPVPTTIPSLIAVLDGTPGVVILEWRGGPADALRWQYRQALSSNWEPWTDIPNSSASTGSYRLSGLQNYGWYDFQVRAWTSTGAGQPSDIALGVTPYVDDEGAMWLGSGDIVMGGKTYRLFGYHLDIPTGMRLKTLGPAASSSVVGFADIFTGSRLELDANTGEFLGYSIISPDKIVTASRRDTANDAWILDTELSESLTRQLANLPKKSGANPWAAEVCASTANVAQWFDQIADSIRKAPPQ